MDTSSGSWKLVAGRSQGENGKCATPTAVCQHTPEITDDPVSNGTRRHPRRPPGPARRGSRLVRRDRGSRCRQCRRVPDWGAARRRRGSRSSRSSSRNSRHPSCNTPGRRCPDQRSLPHTVPAGCRHPRPQGCRDCSHSRRGHCRRHVGCPWSSRSLRNYSDGPKRCSGDRGAPATATAIPASPNRRNTPRRDVALDTARVKSSNCLPSIASSLHPSASIRAMPGTATLPSLGSGWSVLGWSGNGHVTTRALTDIERELPMPQSIRILVVSLSTRPTGFQIHLTTLIVELATRSVIDFPDSGHH